MLALRASTAKGCRPLNPLKLMTLPTQGGILSPILANIYLHELDKKIEQLRSDFSKSAPNSCSYEYGKVVREIRCFC